jgi:hypothetical protein
LIYEKHKIHLNANNNKKVDFQNEEEKLDNEIKMSKLENALCQDQSLTSLKKNGSSSNDRRGSFEGSHRGSNQPNYSLSNGNSRFENDECMSYEKNIYGGKNVDFMHSIQESEEFLVKGS